MKQPFLIITALAVAGFAYWLKPQSAPQTPSAPPSQAKPQSTVVAVPQASVSLSPPPTQLPAALPAPNLNDQIIVSFGKVDEMGNKTGTFLSQRAEHAALRTIPAPERTPEQTRRLLELDRAHAEMLGMLPEIEQFQNSPDEYSRFFGSLIATAAGLNAAQNQAVTSYMKQRAEAMIASGLNAAKEPTDVAAEEKWEEQRDEFNEVTAEGVIQLLPPGVAQQIGFDDKFMELMERDFDKAEPVPKL